MQFHATARKKSRTRPGEDEASPSLLRRGGFTKSTGTSTSHQETQREKKERVVMTASKALGVHDESSMRCVAKARQPPWSQMHVARIVELPSLAALH